ncbi:MAG TPA: hypothetical protein VHB97_21985 [Polyangia bacterium]|nr:hypothetical protein [Polyangia bacterium]
MREDMFEVIIERPRTGANHRRKPGRPPRDPDDWPRHGRMGLFGSKSLNENLAPLYRFLRSRVGRDWNSVHREIAAQLSMNSAVQKHVLDHVKELVEVNPLFLDGVPYPATTLGGTPRPLGVGSDRFYVCPTSGRLLEAEPSRPVAKPPNPDRRLLDGDREARRIDGIWYEVTFAPLPPPDERGGRRDLVARCALDVPDVLQRLRAAHGHESRYAWRKRQLSSRAVAALTK